MKLYKKLDLWLQILLVIAVPFLLLMYGVEGLIIGYVTVGSAQVLSLIIHAFLTNYYYPVKTRRSYALCVLGAGIFATFFIPVFYIYIIALLFISPFLAGWYIIICKTEIGLLEEKSLTHLKR